MYTCRQCNKQLSWNGVYCSKACQQAARQRHKRYAPATLREMRIRSCQMCDKVHRRDSQYCSDACKQKAYRRRKDPQSGSWQRRQQRAQQAARSKHRWQTRITCQHCGETVVYSVAESTNRRYCTNACKQAAYRERRKQK